MTLSGVDSNVEKLGIKHSHQMGQGPRPTIMSSAGSNQLVKRDVAEAEGWLDSWNVTSPARVSFSEARQLNSPLQQQV